MDEIIEWYIPLHINPLPSYPGKHLQIYEPGILMQFEDPSVVQSSTLIKHSSKSIKINIVGRMKRDKQKWWKKTIESRYHMNHQCY